MPILALEGPDRCGKSTLFQMLRSRMPATYVAGKPRVEELLPVIGRVEQWQAQLWSELYDPCKLYVADRSFTVTPEVYSKLYGRKLLFDVTRWRKEQYVVYLDVPASELRSRGRDPAFDPARYEEVQSIYRRVLRQYRTLVLRRLEPVDQLCLLLQDWVGTHQERARKPRYGFAQARADALVDE